MTMPMPPDHTGFLTDHAEIRAWLAKYFVIDGEISIADDGRVSTTGSVAVSDFGKACLTRLAVKFYHVAGYFECTYCERLLTLEGFPQYVEGCCYCDHCSQITTLLGAPSYVADSFACHDCVNLRSLEGAPLTIGSNFYCYACPALQALTGLPAQIGTLECWNCRSLTTFDGLTSEIGVLSYNEVSAPSAETIKHFLRSRTLLAASQEEPWMSLVNAYSESGDLLTAIAQFEAYYGVPFGDTINVNEGLTVPGL